MRRGRWRRLLVVLAAAAVSACDASDPTGHTIPPEEETPELRLDSIFGTWEPGPALPGPRGRHAAIVYRGDLIVAGGLVGPGQFTASVLRLEPGAAGWVELAPLPLQLAGLSLVVTRDTLFAVGGDGPFYSRPEQALFAYDPGADAWSQRRDVPDWRTFAEAVTVDGTLWFTGGQVQDDGTHPPIRGDTILEYVPGEDMWAYGTALPTPRLDHEAVQTPDGTVYLVGGQHGEWVRPFPDIDVYDPATEAWRTIVDPFRTRRIGAAFADPYIHVVAGEDHAASHRALDVRTEEWVGLPRLPRPLEWPKLVHWDGALWLIGGIEAPDPDAPGLRPIFADVYRMDLATLTGPAPPR